MILPTRSGQYLRDPSNTGGSYARQRLLTEENPTRQIVSPSNRASAAGDRSRWVALVVLCIGMLMIVLDATVVNVALPSIQDDLGFSQAGLAWVVNAYLIAFGGLLLLAGRLGDLVGRRSLSWWASGSSPSLRCVRPREEPGAPGGGARKWIGT